MSGEEAMPLPRVLWELSSIPGRETHIFVLICSLHEALIGVFPCKGWGVAASQLALPTLTPLSVAGWGRLQRGAAHWATSVALHTL